MKYRQARPGKKLLVLMAAAAFFTQPGCRSLQVIPAHWLDVPAAASGRLEDFSKMITSLLFENGMMVGMGNDDRSLYIFFSPDIRHQQRPPSRAQLTLWLDENGGSAKKLGLVHVSDQGSKKMPAAGPRPAERKGPAAQPTGPQTPPATPPAATLLKIVDRMSGKETYISADGSLGPAVLLADDWGDYAYQWRIPFQAIGDWPGLNCRPGKAIGVGLLWEIAPLPGFAKKDMADRFAGGPGMPDGEEMGQPPGGMPGGPGGPGGRGMSRDDFKSKRKIWLKMMLLQKI